MGNWEVIVKGNLENLKKNNLRKNIFMNVYFNWLNRHRIVLGRWRTCAENSISPEKGKCPQFLVLLLGFRFGLDFVAIMGFVEHFKLIILSVDHFPLSFLVIEISVIKEKSLIEIR